MNWVYFDDIFCHHCILDVIVYPNLNLIIYRRIQDISLYKTRVIGRRSMKRVCCNCKKLIASQKAWKETQFYRFNSKKWFRQTIMREVAIFSVVFSISWLIFYISVVTFFSFSCKLLYFTLFILMLCLRTCLTACKLPHKIFRYFPYMSYERRSTNAS